MATPKLGIMPPLADGALTSPDWIAGFVQVLEKCGVDSMWVVEHVVVAEDYDPVYPYSDDGLMPGGRDAQLMMPDPLEILAFAAGQCSTLGLGTAVVIASQHSAAILAKRAATLDQLSRGRLMLGVGVGWQREEYEAIGVPFANRGRRLDENIKAMRELWEPGAATYHGKFVNFDRVHSDPKPYQRTSVPVLIGGSTPAAASRAARLGDGWLPLTLSPEDYRERVGSLRAEARAAGRNPDDIELMASPQSWDFARNDDPAFVREYVDAGATRLLVGLAGLTQSLDLGEIRVAIERYQSEVISNV